MFSHNSVHFSSDLFSEFEPSPTVQLFEPSPLQSLIHSFSDEGSNHGVSTMMNQADQDSNDFSMLFEDDQTPCSSSQTISHGSPVAASNVDSEDEFNAWFQGLKGPLSPTETSTTLNQVTKEAEPHAEQATTTTGEALSFQEIEAMLGKIPDSSPCSTSSSSAGTTVYNEEIHIKKAKKKKNTTPKKSKKGHSLQSSKKKRSPNVESNLAKRLNALRERLHALDQAHGSSSMVDTSQYPPKISQTSYVIFDQDRNANSEGTHSSNSFNLNIHYFKGPKLVGKHVFDPNELEQLTISDSPQVIECSRNSVTTLQGLLENHFGVNRAKNPIYVQFDGCPDYHMLYCQKGKTDHVRSLIRVVQQDSSRSMKVSTHDICLNKLSNAATKPLKHTAPVSKDTSSTPSSSKN
ncbi:hypothetical protein C9374_001013 [Naegleria lovaniensis]|uniref:Uncharacterized protein n=1 Tax=Naegleria lovaniensis TaxID=51637 RepID=A0AA88KN38_NAELO|nr:uncharacterized protein C9374_001013 [Naegleria lovaniensis]KAG2388163.1 hypothetical protein C9374_001013 [Naegleria lovaniensis]